MKKTSFPPNGVPAGNYKPARRNSAFTLIELMITISIVLILTVITVAVVNVTINKDRVSGASRQIQSFLEGARNRAIYSTQTLNPGPRGVRFMLNPNGPTMKVRVPNVKTPDPNDTEIIDVPTTVNSMTYIGPPTTFSEGGVYINEDQRSLTILPRNSSVPNQWRILQRRRFIRDGTRIEIPRESSNYYTIWFDRFDTTYNSGGSWKLTKDFEGVVPSSPDYSLELEPAVLPNQEPRLFTQGVAIDAYRQEGDITGDGNPDDQNANSLIDGFHSRFPSYWQQNPDRMDVMFSTRGTVIGRAASEGHIHLVISETVDIDQGRFPGHPDKEGEETIVTINTRTGTISTHAINPDNPPTATSQPTDPFLYAETGRASQ